MITEISTYLKNNNIHLSPHFTLAEFKCKCKFEECEITLICQKLIDLLEKLREKFHRSVLITSGYRCPRYNKQLGGVPQSQHITGYGIDILIPDVKPIKIAKAAKQVGFLGIGVYKGHVHLDIYKERQWTSEKD